MIGEDSCGTPSVDALVAPIVKRCGSAAYPWRVAAAGMTADQCSAGSWKLKREAVAVLSKNFEAWLAHAWRSAEACGLTCINAAIDRCARTDSFAQCGEPICPAWMNAAGRLAEVRLARSGWSIERVQEAWRAKIWEPDREVLYAAIREARSDLDAGCMSWEDWRSMGAEESTQGYLRLNEDRRRPLGQWLASIRSQEPERQCSVEDVCTSN